MDFNAYLRDLKSRTIPKDLAFPVGEYQRRVDNVKASMASRDLDALLITEVGNVCYLTGYDSFVSNNFACMVLTPNGEPSVQITEFEIPGALLNSWVDDVRATRFNDPEAVVKEFVANLQDRHLEGKRIGLELKLPGISVNHYEGLKRALPNATFVDVSDLVFSTRVVKSDLELAYIRKAAGMVTKAVVEAVAAVGEGVTENDIASVGYSSLAKQGSEYFSCQPCVIGGYRAGWIHTSHRGLRLKAGDAVMFELGAFCRRYGSAVMHTVAVGSPSPIVKRLSSAANDTLTLLQQAVRPGRTAHDVAVEVKKGIAGVAGEAYSTGMFGYAIGISFPPTWREGKFMIAEGVDQELVPGMTFLAPLTLRIPGKIGVGFTDTFAVTNAGCEWLTKRDRSLSVAT